MSNTDALRAALADLLKYAEGNECQHESTHRGGAIWTICDDCGRKWSDDRDPFTPYQEPKAIEAARAALAQTAASGEPVAWFCEWFNADGSPEWDQYHDRTDPMPSDDEWEDRPPDRVTPLYATAQPAPARAPVAWHCTNDPDSATAFFWRRPSNGACPNCGKKLVPVVLAAAPGAPDAGPNV